MYSDNQETAAESRDGELAIRVEGLGKCYRIYNKPRDRLLQMFPWGRQPSVREFWALRDVSFTVNKGETMGIIGPNGSGKSTLLQMICGTLNPTLGQVSLRGKVAALLELGAGFNPEFTGRENIFMSASLYGLNHDQVVERFDRIAAFADIGDHLEQPVKTYSSGMYVRLAFAVIAHVDADVLVIDEALAVGDAVFTQKCMRFIRRFREKGTLLFVSHDMGSVLNLCEAAVWLHEGQVREIGPAKRIVENYLHDTLQSAYGEEVALHALSTEDIPERVKVQDPAESAESSSLLDYASRMDVTNNLDVAKGWRSGVGEILEVTIENLANPQAVVFKGGETISLWIRAVAHEDMNRPILGFLVRDRLGQDLFGENTLPFTDQDPVSVAAGTHFQGEFVFRLPMLPNGHYTLMASLASGDLYNNIQHHWLHDALLLTVSSSKVRWGLVGVPFKNITLRKVT
jgi:lipopolysaccharide transport system ATP-binding protein